MWARMFGHAPARCAAVAIATQSRDSRFTFCGFHCLNVRLCEFVRQFLADLAERSFTDLLFYVRSPGTESEGEINSSPAMAA